MATNPSTLGQKHRGKVYNIQSRGIISRVMDFMKAEGDADRFIIDCRKVRERVTAATGASKSTQTRICAEKRKLLLESAYDFKMGWIKSTYFWDTQTSINRWGKLFKFCLL